MATEIRGPYTGPEAWTAAELARDEGVVVRFTDAALREIDHAIAVLRQSGAPLDAVEAADFPLPGFAAERRRILELLHDGPGVALLRGLPVDRYQRADLERLFWGLGAQLGIGVSQSHKGDRLGEVMDIGEAGRYYTVGGALEMHVDPVDVVGLMCLRKAARGGESRIASAAAVHNAIAVERPDLARQLYLGFHHTSQKADRSDGAPAYTPYRMPTFDQIDGRFACFILPIAARNVETEGLTLTDLEREAMAYLDATARRQDLCHEMDLEPGDIQFLNNRLILHGRADYEDAPEPDRKRLMLRLWLMMPDWPARPQTMNMHAAHDRAAGGIARI